MKSNRYLAILLLCIFAAACRPVPPQIEAARDVVAEHPDSALRLLGEIGNPLRLRARDYARYALLTTKARYRLGEELVADTLLDAAVGYYTDHPRDSSDVFETFYYAGQLARRRREPEQAMNRFLRAKASLPSRGAWERHYLIETWIGVLAGEQRLFRQKIAQARRALRYADSLDNDNYRSISMSDLAHGFLGLRQFDSVVRYTTEGLPLAEKFSYPKNITAKLALLTEVEIERGDYSRALELNARSIRIADPSNRYGFYMERANIFNRLGQYDSVFRYIRESLHSPGPQKLENLALRHEHLATAYAGKGRYDSAFYHMSAYSRLQDSVFDRIHMAEVYETGQLFRYNKLREENLLLRTRKLQRERWHLRIMLLLGTVVLLIGAGYFITWQRSKRQIIHQQRKLIRQHELLERRTQEKQEADRALERMQRKEEQLRSLFFRQMSLSHLGTGTGTGTDRSLRLSDDDWLIVYRHADEVFDRFTERLRERFPLLNEFDVRFCCMVKMQLSQAEIARIACMEKDSVKKRLKRIRLQKMAAGENRTLEEVLRNI